MLCMIVDYLIDIFSTMQALNFKGTTQKKARERQARVKQSRFPENTRYSLKNKGNVW